MNTIEIKDCFCIYFIQVDMHLHVLVYINPVVVCLLALLYALVYECVR